MIKKTQEKISSTFKSEAKDQAPAIQKILEKEGFGGLKLEYARLLTNQTDVKGERIGGKVMWLKFKPEKRGEPRGREGKLFFPSGKYNGTLVCGYVGSPGKNVVQFEKKFAKSITDEGNLFWSPRHSGFLTKDHANEIIGSREREEDALKYGHKVIGDVPLSNYFLDLLDEPLQDVETLARLSGIKKIVLLGGSFGGTGILHALIDLKNQGRDEVLQKIERVIIRAPFLGDGTLSQEMDERMGGLRMKVKDVINEELKGAREYFQFAVAQTEKGTLDALRNITQEMFNPENAIPSNVKLIFILSPTDPYFTLEGVQKYFAQQNQGLFIIDLTHGGATPEQIGEERLFGANFMEPDASLVAEANKQSKEIYGGSQHNLPNLRPETLLRLINLKVKGKHVVCLRSDGALDDSIKK